MPKYRPKLTRAQLARARVPEVPVVVQHPKPGELRERQFAEAIKSTPADEVYIPFKLLPEHGITYSRPTVITMVKDGRFPRPYELSPHRKAWKLSDLNRWKETRPAWRAMAPRHLGPKAAKRSQGGADERS